MGINLNPLEMDQPWKGTIRRCSTYIMHNLTCIHYCEISIYIPLQCLMLLLRNIMYMCIPVCTHVYIYEITCWQSTLFMRTQSHSIFYFIHFINGINGQWNLHFGFGLYIRQLFTLYSCIIIVLNNTICIISLCSNTLSNYNNV